MMGRPAKRNSREMATNLVAIVCLWGGLLFISFAVGIFVAMAIL